ncbi:Thymidylate kinase [Candidatus Phytoplasma mali]|uniref:Thymidylate kinase n=1 Tax=Phytoplasma mali (strain AT) TaxID=482235 RepID=B3R023_PHYMT|nr:dTMP kinase [Candidatus Phytoplasma mali]CAP18560.1 Thymidylate kinase [Candidatus Phytoplasma mali]
MFISFEGCEGTGKTVLSKKLEKKLIEKNYLTILTKEPGGCLQTQPIKKILLNSSFKKLHCYTESLLYAADRIEHLNRIIIPSLQQKKIVICDRFLDSSVAYQGYGRNLGEELIYKINFYALKYLPDITFYIDIDPFIGVQRIKNFRKEKLDNFDLEKMDFHERVREGYLNIFKKNKSRIILIDGNQSLENIFTIIYQKVIKFLNIKVK